MVMEVNALQVAYSSWGENNKKKYKNQNQKKGPLCLDVPMQLGLASYLKRTHNSAAPDALVVLTGVHFQFITFPNLMPGWMPTF